jgi:NADPH:quinone reductase-like Zn-dependent oxidoreductase
VGAGQHVPVIDAGGSIGSYAVQLAQALGAQVKRV